jgi:predicted SAM-dependent methyltransferase
MKKLSLNIGSGDRTYDEYPEGHHCINLDKRLDWEVVDVISNARLLPFEDEVFDYILASDILEHFPFRYTRQLLEEWARVLTHDGTIEIRTPDLTWVQRTYDGQNAQFISHHIFGGQDYQGNYHYVMFDRKWLNQICNAAGLAEISYESDYSNFIMKVGKTR